MTIRYFFLPLLLVLCSTVNAQQYDVKKFVHPDFSIDADISAVVQDYTGVIWIGTKSGLYSYDGYEVRSYEYEVNNDQSLSHNFITDLQIQDDSTVWISTYGGGANLFSLESHLFKDYIWSNARVSGLRANTCLGRQIEGHILIGSREGVLELNLTDGALEKVALVDNKGKDVPLGYTNAIYSINANDAIVATKNGLFRISRIRDSLYRSIQLSSDKSLSIEAYKGNYLIGSSKGLFLYDEKDTKLESYFDQLSGVQVEGIWINSKDEVWIATDSGLYKLSKELERIAEGHYVAIYEDESGMMWAVTFNEGIYLIIQHTNSFVSFENTKDAKIEGITSIDGVLWIRSHNGTFWIDEKTKQATEVPLSSRLKRLLAKYRATNMLRDADDDLWISVYDYGLLEMRKDDLGRYNIVSEYNKDNSNIGTNIILGLEEDKEGNVWAATFGQGLSVIRKKNGNVQNYNTNNSNIGFRALSSVALDRKDKIWISTFGAGVEEFDGVKFTSYRNKLDTQDSMSHEIVVSFLIDENVIWAGTFSGGLNKLDFTQKTLDVYSKKTGLAGNLIYAVAKDHNDNIWVNTDLGISVLDNKTKEITSYREEDGVPSQEGEFFSLAFSDGYGYVGTSSGAYYFNVDSLSTDEYKPQIKLRSLRVNHHKIPVPEKFEFTYDQKDLTFEFSSSDYRNPANTNFLYMLVGYHNDWHSIGEEGRVEFTNLQPGNYTLLTKSTNGYRIETDNLYELKFVITPAWWQTLWFKLLSLIVGLTILYFLYKLITNRMLKEKELLLQKEKIISLEKEKKILGMNAMIEGQEAERVRIAKDLHDGLGGLLSTVKAHFSNIQSEIQRIEKINVYNRANELVDEACDEVRRISHNLMPGALRLEGLKSAVEQLGEDMVAAHPFAVKVEAIGFDTRMDESKEVFVFRIIQEALNNIIKHANANEVLIQMSETVDEYYFIVEDDGDGFDPLQIQSGLGLKSIQSRVDFLKGNLDVDTRVGVGTTLSWHIPK